jgi:hypothetical protein
VSQQRTSINQRLKIVDESVAKISRMRSFWLQDQSRENEKIELRNRLRLFDHAGETMEEIINAARKENKLLTDRTEWVEG